MTTDLVVRMSPHVAAGLLHSTHTSTSGWNTQDANDLTVRANPPSCNCLSVLALAGGGISKGSCISNVTHSCLPGTG